MVEGQQDKALSEEQLRRAQDEDVRTLMAQLAGRRFVWRLLDTAAGTFQGSFTGDALTTAYAEGRRSVGLALLVEVQRVAAASYLEMLREELTARLRQSLPGTGAADGMRPTQD